MKVFSRHASHRANPSRGGHDRGPTAEPHGAPLPLLAAATNLISREVNGEKTSLRCAQNGKPKNHNLKRSDKRQNLMPVNASSSRRQKQLSCSIFFSVYFKPVRIGPAFQTLDVLIELHSTCTYMLTAVQSMFNLRYQSHVGQLHAAEALG